MENIKYSRNFGRAWSYVQLCQAIPVVLSVAISGLYFSVGNYVSVASLLAASLMLSLINIHKHNRGKRRRLRRLNTVDKEEKGEERGLLVDYEFSNPVLQSMKFILKSGETERTRVRVRRGSRSAPPGHTR